MRAVVRLLCAVFAASVLTGSTVAVAQPAETWGDYTLMFDRSAGQHWSGSAAAGQWAWDPQSTTESHISWGQPSAWPPTYVEKFVLDGDWVRLDGWWDNNTYYTLRTSVEWSANTDCATSRVELTPGGAQRYAKWVVTTSGYCLFTVGTITEQSSGKLIAFAHQQVWTRQQCTNPDLGTRSCLQQEERWWDDNAAPWAERLHRVQHIGYGAGMAYLITAYQPGTVTVASSSTLKYIWSW